MDNTPEITIIIPVYNRAWYILNTLRSVKEQNFKNFECLIIEDHSTDDSDTVIKKFIKEDHRFTLVKNKRTKGAPGARNTGIDLAKGKYITFLDSDDNFIKETLQHRIEELRKDEKIDLLITNYLAVVNGIDKKIVNRPTKEHPLLRFFSLYPYNDIPWILPITIKTAFLRSHEIYFQESLERFQDIQFNLSVLLKEPTLKWQHQLIDTRWCLNGNQENIGKDLNNYGNKLIALGKFYLECLTKLPSDFVEFHRHLYKRTQAFFVYHYFNIEPKEARILLDYFREINLFNKMEINWLTKYHSLQPSTLKGIIRLHFKLKLHKAFGAKNFLKIKYTPA